MGLAGSRTNHPALPYTELTPCAILLYRLGYRVVALSFEHAVVNMTPVVTAQTRKGYFVVNPYIEDRRRELVQTLSAHVSDDACTFIVSLLAQGIAVVVTTEAKDRENGDVVKASSSSAAEAAALLSSSSAGYQYDGVELVRRVLLERLGPDLAPLIHVDALDHVMHHKRPEEALVVSPLPEVVKKARKRHMGAILVSEYVSAVH